LLKTVAGGLDISNLVQRIVLKFDFANRVSECSLDLVALPDAVDYWQPLQVSCGLHSTGGDTASDIAGQGVYGLPRFDGYVTPISVALWPTVPKIEARGPLILAERIVCPDDLENVHNQNPTLLPSDYKYDAPGRDLSANPDTNADWTDADMVVWLLGQCGLTGRIDPTNGIGGTERILGAIFPEPFTWRRGASALSFMEDLDKGGPGFRTYERLNGIIARQQTSPRVPFNSNRITFTEGADIFEDATLNRSAIDEKNRVLVTGFDDGKYANSFVSVFAIDHLPPGVPFETDTTSSPMLEVATEADVIGGAGLSCEAVAAWRQQEVQSEIIEATFSTWRDDAISPGDTVYLNSPHLLGVNQTLWCTGVQITVEAGQTPSFTQRITARGVAARNRVQPPYLPFALPMRLMVNP
jgi:hypothetical protein